MPFRALLFTYDEQVMDFARAIVGLPIDWFFAVCPDQAAALVEQADFDLVVIDCDSLAGRELATVAQESRENHIFRLLCLCSGEAGIQATIVQKPINIQSLTNALHGVLPLFP